MYPLHSSLNKSGTTQKSCIELPEFLNGHSLYTSIKLQKDISVYTVQPCTYCPVPPPSPSKVAFTDIIYTWRGDPCPPRPMTKNLPLLQWETVIKATGKIVFS